jgi:solute carrier family 34 (sodium-dependent phosphate cotransporter)
VEPVTESPARRFSLPTWGRVVLVVALLYLFLVGVKGLETGIKELGSGFTDALFEGVSNPLAALFVGILGTVLVQSSSVTTATIVGLVAAGTVSVESAVPMVMGANIGTTVTNTLASLGYLRRSSEFRLAFAGATMHDFFNLLTVLVVLPVEIATGFLSRWATSLAGVLRDNTAIDFTKPDSPIKAAVKAPITWIKDFVEGITTSETAIGSVVLIAGLVMIFFALAFITRNMRLLVLSRIERSVNAVLGKGGGLPAMVLGLIITVSVQSSSITTSVLIPLIAAGVLSLQNAFPVTLGANVGTTVTALLASLATDGNAGLAIALAHTMFNLLGILIWYPFPRLRVIPVRLAERLAVLAEVRKSLVLVYVVGGFILVPLIGVLVLR